MPNTLQDFLCVATQKAADDLTAALLRIPEDKRDWSPEGRGRTALDQVAECAILAGYTAELIHIRTWSSSNFDAFAHAKSHAVSQEWDVLHAMLQKGASSVITAILAVPDDTLGDEIELPWSKMALTDVMALPYWNMSYHLGQINYVASMLGVLD